MNFNTKVNPNLSLKVHVVDGEILDRGYPHLMRILRSYADDKHIIACGRVTSAMIFDAVYILELAEIFFCTSVGADLLFLGNQCHEQGIDILEIIDTNSN